MHEKPLMNKKVQSRRAIAMIELIFAIVIIGITLLSIPNLIYQASESGYTTIQQESIAAAASDLSLILSREWDEVGTSDEFHTPILTTNSDGNSTSIRPGARSRSFFTGIGGPYPASPIGTDTDDAGNIDDIDDIDGIPDVKVVSIDGEQDLIDIKIYINTDVNYISDAATWNTTDTTFDLPTATTAVSGTSNIKKITVTLETDTTAVEFTDKKIVFNAFSSNIGSYKLERRELP